MQECEVKENSVYVCMGNGESRTLNNYFCPMLHICNRDQMCTCVDWAKMGELAVKTTCNIHLWLRLHSKTMKSVTHSARGSAALKTEGTILTTLGSWKFFVLPRIWCRNAIKWFASLWGVICWCTDVLWPAHNDTGPLEGWSCVGQSWLMQGSGRQGKAQRRWKQGGSILERRAGRDKSRVPYPNRIPGRPGQSWAAWIVTANRGSEDMTPPTAPIDNSGSPRIKGKSFLFSQSESTAACNLW